MLADELAAVVDELLRAFLFSGLVVPAAGEGDFHRRGRADGAGAQEEGGVAGDNLGVGESADVADLGLFCGEFEVGDLELAVAGCDQSLADRLVNDKACDIAVLGLERQCRILFKFKELTVGQS